MCDLAVCFSGRFCALIVRFMCLAYYESDTVDFVNVLLFNMVLDGSAAEAEVSHEPSALLRLLARTYALF